MKKDKLNRNINQGSISLQEFDKRFSVADKKAINQEIKYLKVLMSLREARKKAGLTQEKLSQISKVPRATITKIESGSRNATLQTIMSIAQAMGKNIEVKLV